MILHTKPPVDEAINEEFTQLFEEYIRDEKREGQVVQGTIVKIDHDSVSVDVGLKSEGRVALSEFSSEGLKPHLQIGDIIEVFIERLEGRGGRIVLSREKAIRDAAWIKFEQMCTHGANVEGSIMGRVKGGFAVELGGIVAFLPGSQVDIRPVKDASVLVGVKQLFKILKVDKDHGNVVVSRRAILDESRQEVRQQQLGNIKEGEILEGVVKNITNYGAFVDLSFIDGLLHITDISWSKISHPSEVLSIGQTVKVMVIKYNPESQRISLGLKQLGDNPWHGLEERYPSGTKLKGVISTVVDYGAFVELEPSVEGLVYHTEMSWNLKNVHPRKLFKPGDEVEVVVLEIDVDRHRIGLSIKRCKDNPWVQFAEKYPIGSAVQGVIKNIADFGMFMTVDDGQGNINPDEAIDVLIPAVEISWTKSPEQALKDYEKGDQVQGVVENIDLERERVTISIKKATQDDVSQSAKKLMKVGVVTCSVVDVQKDGIEVELEGGGRAFIKKTELSKHKDEQRVNKFSVGDRVDAKVMNFDDKSRQFSVSIRALEADMEKKAIAEFGSADSGASLGDILGAALEDKENAKNK